MHNNKIKIKTETETDFEFETEKNENTHNFCFLKFFWTNFLGFFLKIFSITKNVFRLFAVHGC